MEKKFLFDINLFDEEHQEIEEDLPPPPPVFSEEELETAKKKAFAEGRALAGREALESQNQAIANTLGKISKDMVTLFNAERERAKLYEQEAVHLAVHVFKALFPFYTEKCGFEELKSTLTDVLEKRRGVRTVHIHVAPDVAEGVAAHMASMAAGHPDMACEVTGDPALKGMACRMDWKDGGALYEPQTLAQEVLDVLKQTLAADGFSVHDGGDAEAGEDTPPEIAPKLMEKPDE